MPPASGDQEKYSILADCAKPNLHAMNTGDQREMLAQSLVDYEAKFAWFPTNTSVILKGAPVRSSRSTK
jgi:hypothetical protein